MTNEQRMKNLLVPIGMVDVVLDTDAYNEIDDQFAIAYLLSCKEKLTTKAIYAAPFFNSRSSSPADGMEKSYLEIFKILDLMGVENFDPMPYEGHANETFEINGVKFSYSDYIVHPGYNNTKSHGGVIKENGQHLKIGYVYLNETYGNIIVYIEQLPE